MREGHLRPLHSPSPTGFFSFLALLWKSGALCLNACSSLPRWELALPKLMAGCSTEWNAGRIDGFVTSAHNAVDPGEGQQSHWIEQGFSHPSAQLLGGMWSRSRFVFISVLAHLFLGRDSCCLLPEGLTSQAVELGDAHT